jgi:hypothetical protein
MSNKNIGQYSQLGVKARLIKTTKEDRRRVAINAAVIRWQLYGEQKCASPHCGGYRKAHGTIIKHKFVEPNET